MFPPVEKVESKQRFLKLTAILRSDLDQLISALLPDTKLARTNRNYRKDLPIVPTNMMVSCEDDALIVPSKKIINRSKNSRILMSKFFEAGLSASEIPASNPNSWIGPGCTSK
jgi:hypothetical protein